MPETFWTHTVWYLALLALTIIMIAIAQSKADNRRFLTAYSMAVLGVYYLFEYVLVVLLDAYQYHPMLLPNDPFQDTVFGNVFSQTSIAASCMLIISLRLRPVWYFVFAAAYYLIELLFVYLGIYVLHWYKTIFTPIVLVVLYWAARRVHNAAVATHSRAGDNAIILFGALALFANTAIMPFKLLKIHVFTGGFFADPSRDHTATALLYGIIFIGALVSIRKSSLKQGWKALLMACLYLAQYAAFKAGLMTFANGWFPWATLLEIAVCFLWIILMDRLVRMRRPASDGLPK